VLTAIWEYLLIACVPALINGGSGGLFWSYIWTLVGFTFVELSLAEMASMYVLTLHDRTPKPQLMIFKGTYVRWSVPLGVRVCAAGIPTVPIVRHGMDVDTLMASRECGRLLPHRDHGAEFSGGKQPEL
jgi:hypothetical protein